ncbi:hypothetical protein C2E25_11490 [Geothermobacter hydrogeniphilus]|uniref:Uncharacterized protein n=1 Tax=Geothermobacter hydrogeniphilus TaxID=1969733 RepID=A0A2K2H8Q4_9BACT|nr:hypothetical protein C2E25_11490 [Geothermobacter hydrogeniphilus]
MAGQIVATAVGRRGLVAVLFAETTGFIAIVINRAIQTGITGIEPDFGKAIVVDGCLVAGRTGKRFHNGTAAGMGRVTVPLRRNVMTTGASRFEGIAVLMATDAVFAIVVIRSPRLSAQIKTVNIGQGMTTFTDVIGTAAVSTAVIAEIRRAVDGTGEADLHPGRLDRQLIGGIGIIDPKIFADHLDIGRLPRMTGLTGIAPVLPAFHSPAAGRRPTGRPGRPT